MAIQSSLNSIVDIVNMLLLFSFSIKIKIIHNCIDLRKHKLFSKESFSGKIQVLNI